MKGITQLRRVIKVVALVWLTAAAYAANPVPTVTGPTHPQAVVPGSGSFALTVYGANFVSGATVNWNGSPRSTTFVSARELQPQILTTDVAKATAGYITVTNPAPGGGPSSSSYAIVEVHTSTKTVAPGQPTWYQLGGDSIFFLTTGDFYNQNRLDLLAAGGTGNVYLMKNKGDGTFPQTSVVGHEYPAANCNSPKSLAVGDFNNDGNLDFLVPVGKFQQPESIHLRLGNGKGKFQTNWEFGKYQTCPNFAVGDFNGDGNLDFAAVDPADLGVQIFLGNGDGTFRQGGTYGNLPGSFAPVAADFDGNGTLDLVVDTTGAGLQILLGNGDGTFQSPRTVVQRRPKETGLGCGFDVPFVVDDFNGDGKLDVAYCSGSYAQIGVVFGNGDGTFQKPVYYHAGTKDCAWEFAAGDFTSNGITDFIIGYCSVSGTAYFATLLGNEDGTFQKEAKVFLPHIVEALGIVVGDWNSDGLLDFVMVPEAGGVQVYRQK